MNKVIIFADATCDLSPEFIKEHNIQIIGLRYSIGQSDGMYFMANKPQLDDFYGRMRKGENASTSLVLYADAEEAFEPFFREGYDIFHLGLSSGLAKTYENANNAGKDLAKKYGRKFYAPDTKTVSVAHYFIIKKLVKLIEQYKNDPVGFEKIVEEMPDFYSRIKAFFTVEDLKYLHKSGRLSGTAAFIGGILKIKPIITVDNEGKLTNFTKKSGRLQSIQFLVSLFQNIDPEFNEIAIIHADCPNDAKILEQKLREQYPTTAVSIHNMGFIIGCHTGPGLVGAGFVTAKN